MPNKFGDISSNIDILDGQVLRSKTDGTGFESYDIESALNNKADQSTTYTKTETDSLLDNKLEASDIVNFETTTQLNARDTANRNRANHTGTQTASTISDFQSSVSANTNVAANTSARHTHSNKALLDTYTQTEVDLVDAVTKKHTHPNKTILDNTTASFTTADETKLDGIEAGAEVNTLNDIIAGTNITIDKTDPLNPIISSTGGGGTTSLDDLTDVIITTPANGQALTYNGTQWVNSTPAGSGDMLKSENLSGLANYATARTNLGLDTTENQTDSTDKRFMTDIQKSKLDTISGTNTGDETKATIESKLIGTITSHNHSGVYQPLATVLTNTTASYTTAIDTRLANTSGTNTGDQDLSGYVLSSSLGTMSAENTTSYYTNTQVDTLLSGKANTSHTHTTTDITDLGSYTGFDTRYYTETETDALLGNKQNTLVSGTNIKTILTRNILGSGNIVFDIGELEDGDNLIGRVGTKQVLETAIGDDKILVYKTSSGKLEYEAKPTGGGGSVTTLDKLEITGTQYVGVVSNYRASQSGTMAKFSAYLETAPTGANFIVVLKINGTTQATVTITAGSNSGTTTSFTSATLAEGDLITYEITQNGSTVAGSGLTLALNLS